MSNEKGHLNWKRGLATGTVRKDHRGGQFRETCVRFEKELFEEIRQYAAAESFSFGEAVRTLCQIGLEEIGQDRAARKTRGQ
jgi:hypothetical protein